MKNSSKRIVVISLLLVAIMALGGITTYADSFMPPEPFEIWSQDGTMVFRWCPRNEEDGSFDRVAQAGVYRNDVLIYSVENLPTLGSHANEFLFSSDFRHFAYIPQVGQVMALGFFRDGVLLRAYRIDELVRDMNVVTYSVTMAMWENWQGRDFDLANNTLTIVTRDDITYVFDITTGEIIYDTAGNAPFIPPAEDSFGFFVDDSMIPLWAQSLESNEPQTAEPQPEPPLYDLGISSEWAVESIRMAYSLGLIPHSLFASPRNYTINITRAEFSVLAVALYEHFREPITGRVTFTDTTDPNVEKAAYLGIVTGVGNNLFAPDAPLTREQAAVMLSRLMGLLGMGVYEAVPPNFSDANEISNWAIMSVGHMQSSGIMSGVGDNRFAPQNPYTREQSIVTIIRLFDLVS